MKASVSWLRELLEPSALTPAEAEEILTDLGFPIDAREALPTGDTRLEVEITSNRGDCLSHVGLSREIAARTGRRLKLPPSDLPTQAGIDDPVARSLKLDVRAPEACPRFTARVIKGVRVGPSPDWLAQRLAGVGQRSINNVVDATNLVNFEFGQPTHAFDLDKLAGGTLVVRWAMPGEKLTTLDGKARVLAPDQLVVADAQRAQSLAGVIGGADSEVTGETHNVVLEAATWDPLAVRRAARAHQIHTDASHRFERRVDPRTIDAPARRLARLILELAGGACCEGVLDVGTPSAPPRTIRVRLARCESILGVKIGEAEGVERLRAIGVEASAEREGTLVCVAPAHRPDLVGEIDLIEEIARVRGYAQIPMKERLAVVVRPVQSGVRAVGEIGQTLAALGFFEAVTYSFTAPKSARAFLPEGLATIEVDDDRRKHEPTLRPSVLPGLLVCRKANENARNDPAGGVRLFEIASAYAQKPRSPGAASSADLPGTTLERRRLAMVLDVPGGVAGKPPKAEEIQAGIRLMRGSLEAVAEAMGCRDSLALRPGGPGRGFDPIAQAEILVAGVSIGGLGLVSAETRGLFDLDTPVIACECDLDPLIDAYPPRSSVRPLPVFPGIDRDLSLIVGEGVAWADVESAVLGNRPARLESVEFVGVYRGPQAGTGNKSVTLRLRFRDPTRTLRHEEVDPEIRTISDVVVAKLGASIRVS
jgi:phenylalanyl-tRNA synthetase beta chain